MRKVVPGLSPTSRPEDIAAAVDSCLLQILPRKLTRQSLAPQTGLFSELGLDSMQVLQLVSLLEDVVGRAISEKDLKETAIETIADVYTVVRRVLSR